MYELKKIGKVFTSKFVVTGPSFYKKRIYRAAVSQRLRNTALTGTNFAKKEIQSHSSMLKTLPLATLVTSRIAWSLISEDACLK